VSAARLVAIEAACIAGHLGEWHFGTPAAQALQRGLQMAASRFAPFPEVSASQSQDALFREAVNQALALAGLDPKAAGDARRRAVIEAFNMLDGAVDLAASLSRMMPVEQPSTMKDDRTPMMRAHWEERREHSHTFSHMRG
jgi:hypothetical protein